MSGRTDQVKGRAKEVVGTVTGNKDLESEGKVDRQAGEIKQTIDDSKDKIEMLRDRAEGKGEEAVEKVKDALT
jgi:uncharacterized protein YjbJ (UPF0337 family)